jgi:hypothetical protein
MIIQTFYVGLNFSSRNLLDSAAGGTFMSITLGAATKLLDNMMVNYSEWHTERAPQELHARWEREDEMDRNMKVCTITTSSDVVSNAS